MIRRAKGSNCRYLSAAIPSTTVIGEAWSKETHPHEGENAASSAVSQPPELICSTESIQHKATTLHKDPTTRIQTPCNAAVLLPKSSLAKFRSESIAKLPFNGNRKAPLVPAKRLESNPSDLPSPPAWSNLCNPFTETVPLDYDKMERLDRLIYSLQKGAPIHGNTLPLSWQSVKQTLFEYGEITLDELNSREGTEWLKLRYESLRLCIEAFFDSKAEVADKSDWTLFYSEDFRAFDHDRGTKYWKHHKYSIVNPSAADSKTSLTKVREVAGTDDEGDEGQDEATFCDPHLSVKDDSILPAFDEPKPDKLKANDSLSEAPRDDLDEGVHVDKTMVVDLENWGSEGNMPVENMQDEDALSSEGNMSYNGLVKTIASWSENPSNPQFSKDIIPNLLTNNTDRTVRCHRAIDYGGPSSSSSMPALSNTTLLKDFQDVNEVPNTSHSHQGLLNPVKRTRKRKVATEPEPTVEVHEDAPGGSPRIRQFINNNPPSPGTDIPKENLEDEFEHSSQVSVRTPRPARFRQVTASSSFRSLFGGPPGPQSPST